MLALSSAILHYLCGAVIYCTVKKFKIAKWIPLFILFALSLSLRRSVAFLLWLWPFEDFIWSLSIFISFHLYAKLWRWNVFIMENHPLSSAMQFCRMTMKLKITIQMKIQIFACITYTTPNGMPQSEPSHKYSITQYAFTLLSKYYENEFYFVWWKANGLHFRFKF